MGGAALRCSNGLLAGSLKKVYTLSAFTPMNPFVNFQQRGIELPGGCKDLVDVLRMEHQRVAEPNRVALTEGLADIERYVSGLLQPDAKVKQVILFSYDYRAVVCLRFGPFRFGYSPSGLSALVYVDDTEPLQEQAVRTVFEEAGISPFLESGVLRYALPNTLTEATNLITDLLRRGFGVREDARLGFHSYDWDAP